jgi:hypothetical protein
MSAADATPYISLNGNHFLWKSQIVVRPGAAAQQKPLRLVNGYLHRYIRSSLAGNSHTATSALDFLDIANGAKPERCVDDAKIMPSQPTKETTESRWYSWHSLTARGTAEILPLSGGRKHCL